MYTEVITEQPTLVIRRLRLAPGEAMFWHHDTCRRFTVVVQGSELSIEYADNAERSTFPVHAGMVGWDEPEARVHRAVNSGSQPYEEVVSFYRTDPDIEPQPRA